ncbi:unannotated protein [freshwater metagenome]|uniref:Unannotated protein n=1 Tax=freshwater metagenome TaxID=449393 RepID=A0A6J6NKD3_9ZZZZ
MDEQTVEQVGLPLRVDVTRREHATLLTCTGEVDLATVSLLRTVMNDEVVEGRVDLVIDLRGVDFMDSSGLGALIGAHRKTRAFKGGLRLVVTTPALLRLLAITSLDRVLEICSTLEEAWPADG